MFQFLGRLTAQHPWTILVAWIALAATLTKLAPNWKTQSSDDDVRFLPQYYPSVRAHQLLEKSFPNDTAACRAIIAIERDSEPLTKADLPCDATAPSGATGCAGLA